MLAVAGAKKVYRALHQMRLGDALDLPSDHFSAIVSIGTFTVGHAGPEGFDELIRITRPGGHIIVSIRTDINPDNPHLDRMKEIEADGGWRHVESSREVVTMPWEDANVRNTVLVFSASRLITRERGRTDPKPTHRCSMYGRPACRRHASSRHCAGVICKCRPPRA